MITCWGIRFKSVQQLWEFPGCYVSTVHILRRRLKTLPPEQAVLPDSFDFLGTKYKSIYALHKEVGDSLSKQSLYRRLGLCYNGHKITPEQATCPRIWNKLKSLKRVGLWSTVLISHDLVNQIHTTR